MIGSLDRSVIKMPLYYNINNNINNNKHRSAKMAKQAGTKEKTRKSTKSAHSSKKKNLSGNMKGRSTRCLPSGSSNAGVCTPPPPKDPNDFDDLLNGPIIPTPSDNSPKSSPKGDCDDGGRKQASSPIFPDLENTFSSSESFEENMSTLSSILSTVKDPIEFQLRKDKEGARYYVLTRDTSKDEPWLELYKMFDDISPEHLDTYKEGNSTDKEKKAFVENLKAEMVRMVEVCKRHNVLIPKSWRFAIEKQSPQATKLGSNQDGSANPNDHDNLDQGSSPMDISMSFQAKGGQSSTFSQPGGTASRDDTPTKNEQDENSPGGIDASAIPSSNQDGSMNPKDHENLGLVSQTDTKCQGEDAASGSNLTPSFNQGGAPMYNISVQAKGGQRRTFSLPPRGTGMVSSGSEGASSLSVTTLSSYYTSLGRDVGSHHTVGPAMTHYHHGVAPHSFQEFSNGASSAAPSGDPASHPFPAPYSGTSLPDQAYYPNGMNASMAVLPSSTPSAQWHFQQGESPPALPHHTVASNSVPPISAPGVNMKSGIVSSASGRTRVPYNPYASAATQAAHNAYASAAARPQGVSNVVTQATLFGTLQEDSTPYAHRNHPGFIELVSPTNAALIDSVATDGVKDPQEKDSQEKKTFTHLPVKSSASAYNRGTRASSGCSTVPKFPKVRAVCMLAGHLDECLAISTVRQVLSNKHPSVEILHYDFHHMGVDFGPRTKVSFTISGPSSDIRHAFNLMKEVKNKGYVMVNGDRIMIKKAEFHEREFFCINPDCTVKGYVRGMTKYGYQYGVECVGKNCPFIKPRNLDEALKYSRA